MSRTATTEACPASWRQRQPYWLETDDGQCVPLTISDPRADASNALVFKLDTKLKAKGHALKMELKIPIPTVFSARRSISTEQAAQACPPQEILAPTFMAPVHDHTASGLPRREAFGLDVAAIMRNSYPEHPSAFPRSPTDSDRKEYCTYWIRHGECDYMQQGCRYKHEMPDLMTLRSIGFRNVPEWHKEKMRMRTQRPVRPHPDVLQSILNQANNDSDSESGSDDSDATLAEATRRLTVAPPAANIIVQNAPSSPAPSTIDLLSFDDDDEDSGPEQAPKVPENTPETSSFALPNPPSPNRQGRFVPAGESLPRMSTPPLQPSPPSPSFYKKEEPKHAVEKTVYTATPRPAPVYKQYFKEIKAAKPQEALPQQVKQEQTIVKSSPADLAQIAELQAKLAALAAETRSPSKHKSSIVSAMRAKTPPAPASSPTRAVGLMASKYADRRPQVQGQSQVQSQGQGEKKVGRRSRSRSRDVQKSAEAGSGEKRSRRLPAARARKVASPIAIGGEKREVVIGKK